MEYIDDLYELCETINREIADANEKIRSSDGKMSNGDLDVIDKLTHTLKSIETIIAMAESKYSSDDGSYNGGSYNNGSYNGSSYNGMYNGSSYRNGSSYARGRYSRRDGRYSSRYSRHGDLADEIHRLMEDAPNEQIRKEMQRLAEKLQQAA